METKKKEGSLNPIVFWPPFIMMWAIVALFDDLDEGAVFRQTHRVTSCAYANRNSILWLYLNKKLWM